MKRGLLWRLEDLGLDIVVFVASPCLLQFLLTGAAGMLTGIDWIMFVGAFVAFFGVLAFFTGLALNAVAGHIIDSRLRNGQQQ